MWYKDAAAPARAGGHLAITRSSSNAAARAKTTMTTERRYITAARWLHWLTAVLMVVVITAGLWIVYFEPKDEAFKFRLYNIHESFGVIVFALAIARLLTRWFNPPPPLPPDTPALIQQLAHLTHFSLYALLLLMPTIGFLATNAWGFPLKVFDLIPLPSPIGKDEALAKTLSFLHGCGAAAIGTLIGAHLAGVVYHTFIRRDGVLKRMT
jgi:cytochrome b561